MRAILAACLIGSSVHASAEVPEAVLKIIAAGEATGDPAKAKAVYDAARSAYPEYRVEIDRFENDSRQRMATSAEQKGILARQQTANSGFFSHWDGRGELGAKYSTGSSDEAGFTASLLLRRTGTMWRHKLIARAEYESTNGKATIQNYLLAYQPSYEIGSHLYLYAFTQFERDKIKGFSQRYSLSGGLGYRPFDRPALRLELRAGPAWRQIHYVPDGENSHLAAHVAGDFEWQFARTLKFTESAGAYVQTGNKTLYSHSGLESGIGRGLKARLSYSVEYDTALPNNVKDVDTTSRFTLLYDF